MAPAGASHGLFAEPPEASAFGSILKLSCDNALVWQVSPRKSFLCGIIGRDPEYQPLAR